jgi:phospholipid/cholesterol/gamma-HCH transport system substrate-binding protein
MKLNNETKIGMLVTVVLAILFILTWKTGEFTLKAKGYRVKVQFKDIDRVEVNAPVTLNGFEVGRVDEIKIAYGDITRVELTLWLKESAKLREGAKAYVKNMGFMGEKYVALTTGDEKAQILPPDVVLQGEEPADFQKILVEGETIATNLKEITAQVKDHLKNNSQAIDEIIVNTHTTTKNLASITDNVHERLVVNEKRIDDMVGNLDETTQNLEDLSCDLKTNPWKLMYKERTHPCVQSR